MIMIYILRRKMGLILIFLCKLQYGPIVDIDLKIPPRPPGYAFVEVSVKF